MQSDAKSTFCKHSHQNDRPGPHFEAFGVTLEHFGHQMAPQRLFFARLKFRCKNGNGLNAQERSGALKSGRERGGGRPYNKPLRL